MRARDSNAPFWDIDERIIVFDEIVMMVRSICVEKHLTAIGRNLSQQAGVLKRA
jgi:hypothetical protein